MAFSAENSSKPALVLVAFGTSVPEARKVFEHIDGQARLRYPDYRIEWAFTSQFIIDKLKKQGVTTANLAEVVAELKAEGFNQVVFQSLHVVPGEEYAGVRQVDTSGLQVAYGDPLLSSELDMDAVIKELEPEIDPAVPTVVVAHGNAKHPEFNRRLTAFASLIESCHPNLVVASVEGSPGLDPLQRILPAVAEAQQVRFIPLMVVAGDHILNDVLGDEPESWRNLLGVRQALCSPSLGWNNGVLQVYFSHLDQALSRLQRQVVGD